MPVYHITDPTTGKTIDLRGEGGPPTEQELETIFKTVNQSRQAPPENPELARVTGRGGTTGADELARITPIPGRMRYAPAAGALGLGTAMSLATGGLAAPAAIPLVGLAGAGGAGMGQILRDVSGEPPPGGPSAVENAKEMASQGAQMAAGEGIGRGLTATAQAGSQWLMNRAMNNMASRLSEEFPTISQDMIDHAIMATSGGYDKARELLKGYKAVANAAVQTADAAGKTIPVSVATDAMQPLMNRIANTGDVTGNLSALAKTEQKLTAGRGTTLSISEADALKGELFSEAKTLLKQIQQAGTRGLPQLKVEMEAKLAAARALNSAIDDAAGAAGATGAAGYQAANAQAQKMIGVTRGLKTALRGPQNNYQALVRPTMGALVGGATGETQGHPFLGMATGAALGTPTGMSAQAIALGNPVVQAFLKQLPKPMIEAITSYVSSQPEQGQ